MIWLADSFCLDFSFSTSDSNDTIFCQSFCIDENTTLRSSDPPLGILALRDLLIDSDSRRLIWRWPSSTSRVSAAMRFDKRPFWFLRSSFSTTNGFTWLNSSRRFCLSTSILNSVSDSFWVSATFFSLDFTRASSLLAISSRSLPSLRAISLSFRENSDCIRSMIRAWSALSMSEWRCLFVTSRTVLIFEFSDSRSLKNGHYKTSSKSIHLIWRSRLIIDSSWSFIFDEVEYLVSNSSRDKRSATDFPFSNSVLNPSNSSNVLRLAS